MQAGARVANERGNAEQVFIRKVETASQHELGPPTVLISDIRQMGLFGMSIPEEYGGLGLSVVEEVAAAFVLGKASPAFRSLIGTNNGIGSQGIIIDGTPEQKNSLFAKARFRRNDRILRPYWTRGGFGRRIAPHFRAPRWRSVCSQRHQALHDQRAARWAVHGLRAHGPQLEECVRCHCVSC